jgi:hypothetical protein
LGWHEIRRFLINAGDNIRADRERALIVVAYDTMARRSELVAVADAARRPRCRGAEGLIRAGIACDWIDGGGCDSRVRL